MRNLFSVQCRTAVLAVMLAASSAWGQMAPAQVARQVDQLLHEEIGLNQAAPQADDETFLRRVSLDLLGELPTRDDVLTFLLDDDPGKRAKIIDMFLKEKAYGENWGRYWRDVIMYRRTEQRAALAARPLESYLTELFNKNTAWNKVATSFITANGDVRENGATGLIMAQGGRPEDTVAEISRIFMGIQIQCAQCHDHPSDRWKREQFHELAAFFPRVAVRPNQQQGADRSFIVYAVDFQPRFARRNGNNRFRGTLEHRMPDLENPESQGKLMQPVLFATGQKMGSGVKDADRRDSLSRWMTSRSNPWFAKAFVNRMWSELCGEGFYEPVDDMGPDRECSAPKTLSYLSAEFVESGYDVKWLFRTIMATDAYQREGRSRREFTETPFLANCNQRLRGDQLFTTLMSALDLQDLANRGGRQGPYGARANPQTLFSLTFGYDPSEPRAAIKSSIPQALFMMNSNAIVAGTTARPGSDLARMLTDIRDNKEVVVELYLKVLSREPSDTEVKTCLGHVRQADSRREGFEDILWALVNSTEFLHRR